MTKHGPIKAARARFGNDPETRPTGPRGLAFAVLTQGLLDALDGEPDAQEWLDSRFFEFWCDRCDMNPDYMRRSVAGRLPATKVKRERVGGNGFASRSRYTREVMDRILELRRGGTTWDDIGKELGTPSAAVWDAVKRTGIDPKTVYVK